MNRGWQRWRIGDAQAQLRLLDRLERTRPTQGAAALIYGALSREAERMD